MRAVDFITDLEAGGDPHRLVEESLSRIKHLDPKLNAFITLIDPGEAQGRERGGQGPLRMVPVAVKDNIVTRGVRTTCASRVLETYIPSYDATVVERLKRAGALIVGKTNMDEFAMGSLGTTSAFGPTRNPLDPGLSPGGSSSGSAAAVASRMVPLALGSDTGGSIRLPAAWTGIYGLKPTYGLVSRYGLVSYADSMDQIGPMAGSARDLALLFSVIMGFDSRDPTSQDRHPPPELFQSIAFGEPDAGVVEGLRLAVPREIVEHEQAEEVMVKGFWRSVEWLESQGASVDLVSLPLAPRVPPAYYIIAFSEASSNLARYDGVLYGTRVSGFEGRDWDTAYMENRGLFGWEVKRRIMLGSFALSAGYYDMYYSKALRLRGALYRQVGGLLARYHALLTPGSTVRPLPLDYDASDLSRMNSMDAPLMIANMTGLPAITIPMELRGGIPHSIQLVGGKWSDDLLLKIAVFVEEARRGRA